MKIDDAVDEVMSAVPALTDEQWAQRDEQVRAERQEAERKARRERDLKVRDRMLAAGCRIAALDAVFGELDWQAQAMRHVAGFQSPGIWCLAGGVGCGKTVAATWWLTARGGTAPLFSTAEQFEARGRYDRVFRSTWEGATGIVLDDLGAEYGDDKRHSLVAFDALMDHVSGNRLGMVITTNITGVEFKERYGARIISRIREHGGFFTCGDNDRRGA